MSEDVAKNTALTGTRGAFWSPKTRIWFSSKGAVRSETCQELVRAMDREVVGPLRAALDSPGRPVVIAETESIARALALVAHQRL